MTLPALFIATAGSAAASRRYSVRVCCDRGMAVVVVGPAGDHHEPVDQKGGRGVATRLVDVVSRSAVTEEVTTLAVVQLVPHIELEEPDPEVQLLGDGTAFAASQVAGVTVVRGGEHRLRERDILADSGLRWRRRQQRQRGNGRDQFPDTQAHQPSIPRPAELI